MANEALNIETIEGVTLHFEMDLRKVYAMNQQEAGRTMIQWLRTANEKFSGLPQTSESS
jgi:hypothetical protein